MVVAVQRWFYPATAREGLSFPNGRRQRNNIRCERVESIAKVKNQWRYTLFFFKSKSAKNVPSPGIEPRFDDFQSSAVTDLANSAGIAMSWWEMSFWATKNQIPNSYFISKKPTSVYPRNHFSLREPNVSFLMLSRICSIRRSINQRLWIVARRK